MRRSKVVLELHLKTASQTTCPKGWNLILICVGETKWATSKPHPPDSPQILSAALVFLCRGGSSVWRTLHAIRAQYEPSLQVLSLSTGLKKRAQSAPVFDSDPSILTLMRSDDREQLFIAVKKTKRCTFFLHLPAYFYPSRLISLSYSDLKLVGTEMSAFCHI